MGGGAPPLTWEPRATTSPPINKKNIIRNKKNVRQYIKGIRLLGY